MPGLGLSTFLVSLVIISPLPSIGLPKASTTLPRSSGPTGTERIFPVSVTMSPSWISSSEPRSRQPMLSSSKFKI